MKYEKGREYDKSKFQKNSTTKDLIDSERDEVSNFESKE
jgi:hypothetical protein